MKKPLSSWKIMTSVLTGYQATPEEIQKINGFFFCRWLSCDPRCVNIGNFFNRYYNEVPLEIQYKLAKQTVNGVKYIQMPRAEKFDDQAIANISRFYKINDDNALDYYQRMPEEKREYFRVLYPD